MKKVLTKLRVHREIIRTLDEVRRATVVGGQANCTVGSNVASSCTSFVLALPRED